MAATNKDPGTSGAADAAAAAAGASNPEIAAMARTVKDLAGVVAGLSRKLDEATEEKNHGLGPGESMYSGSEGDFPNTELRAKRQRQLAVLTMAQAEGSLTQNGRIVASHFNRDHSGLPDKAAQDLIKGKWDLSVASIVAGTYAIRVAGYGVHPADLDKRSVSIEAFLRFWGMVSTTAATQWPTLGSALAEHGRVIQDLHRQYDSDVWAEYDRLVRSRATRIFEATGRHITWERDHDIVQQATRGSAPRLCDLCNATDHSTEQCSERFPPGFIGGGGFPTGSMGQPPAPRRAPGPGPGATAHGNAGQIRCEFCHKSGHAEADCFKKGGIGPYAKEKKVTFGSVKPARPGVKCYNCNTVGHLSRDCPQGNNGHGGASD